MATISKPASRYVSGEAESARNILDLPENIEMTIVLPTGLIKKITINAANLVLKIKEGLYQEFGVPARDQILFINEEMLDDNLSMK